MLGVFLHYDQSTLGSGYSYRGKGISFWVKYERFRGDALHQEFLVFLFFLLLGLRPSLFLLFTFVLPLPLLLTLIVAFTTLRVFVNADSVLFDLDEFVEVFSDLPT